jgi:transcriptional regulator with XRE-family HTH domain
LWFQSHQEEEQPPVKVPRSFSEVIRKRRRELDLNQELVAKRAGVSAQYINHIETKRRHPSDNVLFKLARVLDLDPRELFFLANPQIETAIFAKGNAKPTSPWEQFRADENTRRLHHITGDEMDFLSRVAMMGDVRSPRDFIFIITTIRNALGK